MLVNRKNLGLFYWVASGSNLVLPGICSYPSKFWAIDPATLNGLGDTKTSVLSSSAINTNFQFSTSSDVTVLAADYADSNWSSLGWTPGDDAAFYTELSTFVTNNFNNRAINPNLLDIVLVVSRGTSGGVDYSIPFFFFGNSGDVSNSVDSFTALLLHLDSSLADSSANNYTMSAYNTLSYGLGKFSQALTCSSGLAYQNNTPINLGTSDFTIDFWMKYNHATMPSIMIPTTAGIVGVFQDWALYVLTDGTVKWYIGGSDPALIISSSGVAPTDSAFHHYAIVRHGSNFKVYIDGVSIGSATSAAAVAFSAGNKLCVGGVYGSSSFNVTGQIDEYRLSLNVARWISNFSPPTSPYGGISIISTQDAKTAFLLHLDGNFNDASQYGFPMSKSAGTSSYVTGKFGQGLDVTSGGYPYIANDPSFAFGTGDFTIETWVKSALTASAPIATSGVSTVSQDWSFYLLTDGSLGFTILSGVPARTVCTSAAGAFPNDGSFHHVAAVRQSSLLTLYVDGVGVASGAITESLPATSAFIYFGGLENGSHTNTGSIGGVLDESRISVGVARWVSNFTPPASPYSVDANTSLMLHFDNDLVDASSNNATLSTQGTVSFGTGKFSQGLVLAAQPDCVYFPATNINLSNSDFTIDFWMMTTTLINPTNSFVIPITAGVSGVSQDWAIYVQRDGTIQGYLSSTILSTPPGKVVADSLWHHYAFVRHGSNLQIYVDGISVGITTTSDTVAHTAADICVGGLKGGQFTIMGAMDEVRISNIARWTNNSFTPPTSAY